MSWAQSHRGNVEKKRTEPEDYRAEDGWTNSDLPIVKHLDYALLGSSMSEHFLIKWIVDGPRDIIR